MRTPHSEDEIRAYTIGEPLPLSSPIIIADYDPAWPDLFQSEAGRIRAVLGSRAMRIEHAGSTSVPGLAAKPVIDIVLAVVDAGLEDAWLPAMEAAGYALRVRESEPWQHRMLKGPGADINLHVYSAGCPEIDRMLMFRDWLRHDEDDRNLYVRTKLALAAKRWKYVQNYADAKIAVIDDIMARAERYHQELRAAST
jgi:GrpB-like predicted nucleotidyltransferase (UPF0157 family)